MTYWPLCQAVISENSQGLRGLKLHASIDSSRASNFNRLMCFAPPAANNLPNVSITSCAASAQKTPAPYLYSGAVFLGRSHKSTPSCHFGVLPPPAGLGILGIMSLPPWLAPRH